MPMDRTLVAIPCNLSPGAFSGERVFEVQLANGERYTSLAPRQFCWTADGKLVGEREPTSKTRGMIAARIVTDIDETQIQVEIPDGEVIAVDRIQIKPRPTPIVPPSSVLKIPTGQ
jgi:hypothetical protein